MCVRIFNHSHCDSFAWILIFIVNILAKSPLDEAPPPSLPSATEDSLSSPDESPPAPVTDELSPPVTKDGPSAPATEESTTEGKPASDAPKFISHPRGQTLSDGDPLTLSANVSGKVIKMNWPIRIQKQLHVFKFKYCGHFKIIVKVVIEDCHCRRLMCQ